MDDFKITAQEFACIYALKTTMQYVKTALL